MDQREVSVRQSFLEQAALCEKFGSSFTARLIREVEATLDRSTMTGRAILDWQGPPEATGDALALRIAGGLHALARSGSSEPLRSVYPPNAPASDGAMRERLAEAFRRHDGDLLPWLDFAPQTNEVGRSAALYLGLMEIARRTGLPIHLYEIGSSAGINLMLDHYAYRFGGGAFGEAGSALELAPEWEGPVPEPAAPRILSRRGCDLAPLDMSDPAQRRRLEAYVWPDQEERHRRLTAAIGILAASPPIVDRADAADWVCERIGEDRPDGSATVLMHSLTFTYLPAESKAKIRAHMERIGAGATAGRPLAWLAFELNDDNQACLTLRLWPGGDETLLAEAHPHCRFIKRL